MCDIGPPYFDRFAGVSGTGPFVTSLLSPMARAWACPGGIWSARIQVPLVSVPAAIEMGLIARFLERLGDHAVNVTRRIADLGAPVRDLG